MRRGVGRPVIECTFNDGRRLAHNKIISFDLGGKGEGKHCEGKQRQCGRRGGATCAGAELGGRQRGVHEPHGLVFGGSSDRKSRKRKKRQTGGLARTPGPKSSWVEEKIKLFLQILFQ
jgi:hypothetical protein